MNVSFVETTHMHEETSRRNVSLWVMPHRRGNMSFWVLPLSTRWIPGKERKNHGFSVYEGSAEYPSTHRCRHSWKYARRFSGLFAPERDRPVPFVQVCHRTSSARRYARGGARTRSRCKAGKAKRAHAAGALCFAQTSSAAYERQARTRHVTHDTGGQPSFHDRAAGA